MWLFLNLWVNFQGNGQAGVADVVQPAGVLGAGHACLCCACLCAGLEGGGTVDRSGDGPFLLGFASSFAILLERLVPPLPCFQAEDSPRF